MKLSFAIVGCGKLGTTLGFFMAQRGYRAIGVASKSLDSAKSAAELIGANRANQHPWEFTRMADMVFITTPDGIIHDACNEIAGKDGFKPGGVVLHCSGSLPSTILDTARQKGAHIGSLHPLQSFPAVKTDPNPFKGIIAAIEGDPAAIETARRVATDLDAICLEIKTDAKILYHASAVVASNYLVSLMDLSFQLIGAAGISSQDAVRVLYPLVKGTLSNIEKIGIPAALTGPIARGDIETVADHLTGMQEKTPDLIPLYRAIGRHTVNVAAAKGTISEEIASKINALFRDKNP